MTLEQIEVELHKACRAAQANGWTIKDRNYWNFDSKQCCPVSALSEVFLLETQPNFTCFNELPVSRDWIDSFADGFDDYKRLAFQGLDIEAYELGQKFRKIYIKKE